MDTTLIIEIAVGIIVGLFLIIAMVAETRAYRDYMLKANAIEGMAVGMHEFWKQAMGKLSEISATNDNLVEDATTKSAILRTLTTQVEGLDIIVQAYGEALNVKTLSVVKRRKGTNLFGENTNGTIP